MSERLHNRKYLEKYRKELRNNMTFSEARLWSCLKNKQLKGRRFRRQHSIGNYIVDFFCFSEKLAIEVDGTAHDNPTSEQLDIRKDQFLKENSFKVIRIPAIDIRDNLEEVLEEITKTFED
jgi:very-short-patch-repair endonuclease